MATPSAQQYFGSCNHKADEPLTQGAVVLSGATAGVAFWIWALPVDTIKTWIQNGTARNLRHALAQITTRTKLAQLFRGWPMAYGRGAPSAAITVSTYSAAYQFLNDKSQTVVDD